MVLFHAVVLPFNVGAMVRRYIPVSTQDYISLYIFAYHYPSQIESFVFVSEMHILLTWNCNQQ